MAEGGGLLNRYTGFYLYRGFESPPLRHPPTRGTRYGVMPHRSETKMGYLMYFVYSIQSENNTDRYYVGLTSDIKRRLEEHNTGKSVHTNKFRPWKLVTYTFFMDKSRAEKFEAYLKTSSGRAFAKKRL